MSTQTSVQSSSKPLSAVTKQTNAETNVESNVEVTSEQNLYANILLVCSWAGIIFMLITFILYMAGFMHPLIKPSDMPNYWGMNVNEYLEATKGPSGWSWLSFINHSDYLNLIGLAFLGTVAMIGYVSLLVNYLRKIDVPYVVMVTLEIIVITLAASGIFHTGAG